LKFRFLLLGLLYILGMVACTPTTPTPVVLDEEATATPAQVVETTTTPTVLPTLPSMPESANTPTPAEVFPTATSEGSTVNLPIVGGTTGTETAEVVASEIPAPSPTIPIETETPEPPRPTRTPTEPPVMNLRDDLPAMTLQSWERPAGDNGRCMHWLRNQYFTEADLNTNLPRLQQLGAKWVLVVYADENIIHMAAPRFAEAGVIPIWRRMLRPFEVYYDWQRDIELVQSYGLPPYFQIYNEPSLGQEWTDSWEGPEDEQLFLNNLMQASRDVYNAGGYVGWQFVSQTWLDHAIDEVERREGTKIFERFFFIPHSYGDNIPPDWVEDGRGVLGWRYYADQLQQRLGFIPPLIVGEGGWRINSLDEPRFPQMDDATHAKYHVELFNWFQTGTLSNGSPLPDYLFAYCPWLIAEKGDDNAWWDSFAGDRLQTIQAVSAIPPFVRRFSWSE
jgi:hypothetical protein